MYPELIYVAVKKFTVSGMGDLPAASITCKKVRDALVWTLQTKKLWYYLERGQLDMHISACFQEYTLHFEDRLRSDCFTRISAKVNEHRTITKNCSFRAELGEVTINLMESIPRGLQGDDKQETEPTNRAGNKLLLTVSCGRCSPNRQAAYCSDIYQASSIKIDTCYGNSVVNCSPGTDNRSAVKCLASTNYLYPTGDNIHCTSKTKHGSTIMDISTLKRKINTDTCSAERTKVPRVFPKIMHSKMKKVRSKVLSFCALYVNSSIAILLVVIDFCRRGNFEMLGSQSIGRSTNF